MQRRHFLEIGSKSALAAATAFSSTQLSCLSKRKSPNIIVLYADDLGYGDVGVYGCHDIPTPYIDSLAKNGVRCTDGYVSAPQCAPSRAGFLTGKYQQRFGFEYNMHSRDHHIQGLSLDEKTVAEYCTTCIPEIITSRGSVWMKKPSPSI
jgi:hypothetical protein